MTLAFLVLPSPPQGKAPSRANEFVLAKLRPGKDTLATAKKLYGEQHGSGSPDDENVRTWKDACRKHALRMEADERGVIQFITASAEDPSGETERGDCAEKSNAGLRSDLWKTGKGLALGDPLQRVIALYGAPSSRGPSTGADRELELLFYAFDWAGSNVPQVMEVYCDRATARVVQITLAFPSL